MESGAAVSSLNLFMSCRTGAIACKTQMIFQLKWIEKNVFETKEKCIRKQDANRHKSKTALKYKWNRNGYVEMSAC